MRVAGLLFLLFSLSVALAQQMQWGWSGNTTQGGMWTLPSTETTTCMPDQDNTNCYYVSFVINLPYSGVYEVAAMAEEQLKDELVLYVYSSFNPAQPCANLMRQLGKQTELDGGPVVDDYFYFSAFTNYTIVVSGVDQESGLFAVNIFASVASGAITMSSPIWTPPFYDSDYINNCDYYSDQTTNYGNFTWVQPTSGWFDVIAAFSNITMAGEGFDAVIALYSGNITNMTAFTTNPCNATAFGATLVGLNDQDESLGVILPYVNLIAGTTYTAVFSGDGTTYDFSSWGLQVIPTRIRFMTSYPNFVQPERDFPCASSDNNEAAWNTFLFNATQPIYLIDTANAPDPYGYIDTYSFLYQGNNTMIPPSTCGYPLIIMGDTGDVTPVYADTTPGQMYTVVVSTYNGYNYTTGSAFQLYTFTGVPLTGNQPSVSTGATMGGATTAGGATMGGATTAGGATAGGATTATVSGATATVSKTTTSTSTSNKPSSTTNGGSALMASAFVGLVALCVAMF